jgi:ubiquinone/menaquinone biosynthesis C-methylase UbiE
MKISSLDPNENSVKRLNAIGVQAYIGYSNAMPFSDASFDCVVMSEVIEHLDDAILSASLAEIARILKPNGRFIGTTPADENLFASICVCPDCGKRFHKFGHVQTFSETRLIETLKSRFDRLVVSRKYLADPQRLNIKGKIMRLVKILLIKLGVFGEGEQFIWEAVKRG